MAVAGHTAVLDKEATEVWLSRMVTFASWTVGAYLTTMLAFVFVPTLLLGWTPMVVTSGSMEPLIKTGDVVLVQDVDHLVGKGTVVAYDDGNGIVMHRVVGVDADGTYTTKGDANAVPDSTSVSQSQIVGQGRLLVPYIGLARVVGWVWWATVGLLVAVSIPLWRLGTGVTTAIALGLLVIAGVGAVVAVFSETTDTASSTIETLSLDPPTNLTATCAPATGLGDVGVELDWSASPTSSLTGYGIYHDAPGGGTNFNQVGTVGASTTTFVHDIQVSLLGLGTHTYTVRALAGSWESTNSNTDAVGVTSVLGVFICSEQ